MLASDMEIEEHELPKYSVFVDHGYLQQSVSCRRGNKALWYHKHVIPKQENISDAVVFVYKPSLGGKVGCLEIIREKLKTRKNIKQVMRRFLKSKRVKVWAGELRVAGG